MLSNQHSSSSSVQVQAVTGQTVQLLRFAVGHQRCAVRIDAVREILDMPRTTPLPLMPAFVRGVMNLRGSVVPVIDLAQRLELGPATISRLSCVVVVEIIDTEDRSRQQVGMLVDAVYEVFDVAEGEFEPVPRFGTRIEPELIRHVARARGELVCEIDLDAVFGLSSLTELIAAHQAPH